MGISTKRVTFVWLIAASCLVLPKIAHACGFHNMGGMDITSIVLAYFHNSLVDSVDSLFTGDTSFLSLAGLAAGGFAYGFVHTLGPGHGKMVVGTWSLTQDNSRRDIVIMIIEIAILHILSAVIAVALVEMVLTAMSVERDVIPWVRAGSYLIIAGFGLWIVGNAFRRKPASCASCGHHHSDHAHTEDDHHAATQSPLSGRRWVSVLVGAPPCSGAALVLLMSLAHDRVFSGLLIAASIAVGMALALGGLAWLAHMGRGRLSSMITAGNGPFASVSLKTVSVLGGLMIAGFGSLAFAGSWVVLSHGLG